MSLVEKTQQQIVEMIKNHEYDEYNYLPSEGELTKRFGVSRVTVREAVKSLEIRGFLKRIHGKGIYVLDNSVNAMARSISDMIIQRDCTTGDILEVRQIVEEACARLAASRACEKDLKAMEACLNIMESSEIMDEKYYRSDLEFHLQMAKSTKNEMLIAIVTSYSPMLLKSIVAASQLDYCIEQKYHYHRNIYESIKNKDAEKAVANMRIHLVATGNQSGKCLVPDRFPRGEGAKTIKSFITLICYNI